MGVCGRISFENMGLNALVSAGLNAFCNTVVEVTDAQKKKRNLGA